MKKSLYLILISILLIMCVAGCSQNTESQSEINNPILDKIYIYNNLGDTFDFSIVKFYDDNSFHGIAVKSFSQLPNGEKKANYEHYYGTYDINNSALTLNISDKTYAGVILEDGASIQFGDDEFVDWTDNIKDTDPILEEFK